MALRIYMIIFMIVSLAPKSEQSWSLVSRFLIMCKTFMDDSVGSVSRECLVASA